MTGQLALTDPWPLADRVRKARRTSACIICRAPITIGSPIARLIKPAGWCHLACVPIVARTLQARDNDGGIRRR
jgi:hypothetical protein